MKMLFVCYSKSSSVDSSAYNRRILQIEAHCRKLGAITSVLFLGDLFFSSPVLIQPLNLLFILRYLKSFDVISAEGHGPAYFFALTRPIIGKTPLIVYDMHSDALTESRLAKKGRFDFRGSYNGFQMRLTEYIASKANRYFIVAWPDLKKRLLKRNRRIRTENVEIILNGADLNLFKPQFDTTNSVRMCVFTVTYAGSFVSYEGTDPLIRAAEMLGKESIHFKLIGFREDESIIKKEIQKRLGEKATLLDWQPQDKLISELRKSDILIIPADASSHGQSQNRSGLIPTKFAEFLALAKPVIVTSLDDTSKIVEKFDCGFVCEPNAKSIAEAILRARDTSPESLVMKGRNGRKFAEAELDIDLICKKYLQFLNRLLGRTGFQKITHAE